MPVPDNREELGASAKWTTRAQVNGYLFLVHRLVHALVQRDVRMLHDPMRAQARSLSIGVVLAILGTCTSLILAFVRPQGAIGDSTIFVGKSSGALYVKLHDELHPVLNLASARLITGAAENPTSIADAKLASLPRGPIMGIPGAPQALPGPAGTASNWALCDALPAESGPSGVPTTTVIAAPPRLGPDSGGLRPDQALLVTRDTTTYLLYDGKRARVDPADPVMAEALGLKPGLARPVSAGLLDSTVAVPPLAPPQIPQVGGLGVWRYGGLRIGTVIEVQHINSTDYYVIVPEGIQQISAFAAEVLRDANSTGTAQITAVPPDALQGAPVVDTIPMGWFPTTRPDIVTADRAPVICSAWATAGDNTRATLRLLTGESLPLGPAQKPVDMVAAGQDGSANSVYLPPTTGIYVQATGIEPGSTRRDSLFYVADNGVRYGIPDAATAKMLGFDGPPQPAPWQILGRLVPGPTLSRSAALVNRDTLVDPAQRVADQTR
ncbi:type VII secretion protein EccB [Nocardia sp. NPDC127526]|uniref:type VII secretion protein EccB n=1 Tax=Nocardia sp. NPDC127526 TaxID=3345393 RepID=UPI0036321C76